MMENVVNLISTRQAVAVVNEWLVSYVGDRFLAGTPILDAHTDTWRMPILYVYPQAGPLGSVGEASVDALTGELCTCPSAGEIKQQALALYRAKFGTDASTLPATRN
jgi:hypothetical protein